MSPGIRFSKSCQGCGKTIGAGAWCERCAATDPDAPQRPKVESDHRREHPGGHWSPGRDRHTQDVFRRGLVRAYGEQCMAVGPVDDVDHPFAGLLPGRRCPTTTGLQAHHGVDGRDMLLCGPHHAAIDPHARA